MRKLIILAFLTLDGVVQEDPSGGSTYGEWPLPLFDDSGPGDDRANEQAV